MLFLNKAGVASVLYEAAQCLVSQLLHAALSAQALCQDQAMRALCRGLYRSSESLVGQALDGRSAAVYITLQLRSMRYFQEIYITGLYV